MAELSAVLARVEGRKALVLDATRQESGDLKRKCAEVGAVASSASRAARYHRAIFQIARDLWL